MKDKKGFPYVIVKYGQGSAFYLVLDTIWDEASSYTKHYASVPIIHMLSRAIYNTYRGSLKKVEWDDIPYNYKLDALALNTTIRNYFGENFTHTKQKIVSTDNKLSQLIDRIKNLTNTELSKLSSIHGVTAIRNEFSKTTNVQVRGAAPIPTLNQSGSTSSIELDEQDKAFLKGGNVCAPILQDPWHKDNLNNQKTGIMGMLDKIPGLNFSFGEVADKKVALAMNGDLAFKKSDGTYVSVQTGEDGIKKQVHVGELKLDVPFYTLPTQVLEVGDVIILDGDVVIVDEKPKTGGYKFINPITGNSTSKLERTNILGMFFYQKVVSMFSIAGGDQSGAGLGGLNPMTLMLLSGQGSGFGGGGIAEMMVMSQLMGANGGQGVTSILPYLMMNKGNNGGGSDMMSAFFMAQAFSGGNAGTNPFGNLFGQAPKKAVAKKSAKPANKVVKKVAKKKG